MHASGSACQQLSANAFFQRRHGPGHAGRRHPQTPGGRREALLLGDGGEDLHFVEAVHGCSCARVKKIAAWAAIFIVGWRKYRLSQKQPKNLKQSCPSWTG